MIEATPLRLLLLGIALGAIPSSELGRLLVAVLAKKSGVDPSDIRKYNAATEDPDPDPDSDTE